MTDRDNTERTLQELSNVVSQTLTIIRKGMSATSAIHNSNQWPRENTLDNKHVAAVQMRLQSAEADLIEALKYLNNKRLETLFVEDDENMRLLSPELADELTDGFYAGVHF